MSDRTDGLLAQHHLLLAVIHSDWATRLDHKVSAVIIERYFGKFGNSRASLRYLADRTGATRPNIIASVRRLTERGAFSVIREGSGTRPTEYALNFKFSSGIAGDTSASGIADNTSCGIADDTSTGSSGIAGDTKTSLTLTGLQAELHVGEKFEAAPVAPPAVGLAATAAGSASGGGFPEFWSAWPRKHGKKAAHSEWKKITHDVDIVIETARIWADHYAKHGVDLRWIPEPANWLKGERWDEDLPLIHGDAKGAAIAKAKANAHQPITKPANDNVRTENPDFSVHPDETALGTIERVEDYTDEDDGAKSLTIWYRTHDGQEIEHFLIYESPDAREQDRGQEELRRVLDAVDLDEINEAKDLIGCNVDLMINRGKFVSCSKPWAPSPKEPRYPVSFKEIVAQTPLGGWASKIGTAYEDDDAA